MGQIFFFMFTFLSFFSRILMLFEVSEPVTPQLGVGLRAGGGTRRRGWLSHIIWLDSVYISPNSHSYILRKTLDWQDGSERKGSLTLMVWVWPMGSTWWERTHSPRSNVVSWTHANIHTKRQIYKRNGNFFFEKANPFTLTSFKHFYFSNFKYSSTFLLRWKPFDSTAVI